MWFSGNILTAWVHANSWVASVTNKVIDCLYEWKVLTQQRSVTQLPFNEFIQAIKNKTDVIWGKPQCICNGYILDPIAAQQTSRTAGMTFITSANKMVRRLIKTQFTSMRIGSVWAEGKPQQLFGMATVLLQMRMMGQRAWSQMSSQWGRWTRKEQADGESEPDKGSGNQQVGWIKQHPRWLT